MSKNFRIIIRFEVNFRISNDKRKMIDAIIAKKFNINPIVARVIRNRDVVGDKEIEEYLGSDISTLSSPWLFKDMEKAVDILREKGLSKAAKKASRVAAEGAVVSAISADGKTGTIVEVNCETDFVGGNDAFRALAASIAQQILDTNPADVEALLATEMNGKTVKDTVTEAVGLDDLHRRGLNTG